MQAVDMDTLPRGPFLRGGPLNYIASAVMNIVIACAGIGVSLLVTSDPQFQTPHGYSLLALLFAVAGMVSAFGSIVIARLSDRVGRKPMILASLAGVTITAAALGVVTAWWQLYAVLMIHAYLMGGFWPSLEARITDGAEGHEIARRLGVFGIAISVGLLPGPMIGGHLSDLWIRAPFFGAASLTGCLLVILAVGFRREGSHDGHRAGAAERVDGEDGSVTRPVRRAFLVAAWTANATVGAAAAILRSIFPRFAKLPTAQAGLGLSGFEAGTILAAISISMLLMFITLGRYPFWHYRLRYLVAVQLAAVLGCVLFALFSSGPILAWGGLLYGIGGGGAYMSSIYYSLHGHAARATQSGLHEAVMRIGFVAGLTVTAVLMWHAGSQRIPYWVCAAILLGGIAAQVRVVTRARRVEALGRFPVPACEPAVVDGS